MVTVQALFKDFPTKKDVLKDLNLTVKNGEIITISGSNGSGKTTLLKLLAGLILPTKGSISGIQKKSLGYLSPHNQGLFSLLTGEDNLELWASLSKTPPKKLVDQIEQWRELPAFAEALKTPFGSCSSGMKSVLLLFKSMMNRPSLLLLDEPFTNLDQVSRVFITDQINKRAKESAVIITGHIDNDLLHSSRKLNLLEGRLV